MNALLERERHGAGMTRKQHRAVLIFGGVGVLCLAVLLLLCAVRDSVVFLLL